MLWRKVQRHCQAWRNHSLAEEGIAHLLPDGMAIVLIVPLVPRSFVTGGMVSARAGFGSGSVGSRARARARDTASNFPVVNSWDVFGCLVAITECFCRLSRSKYKQAAHSS